MKPEKKSIPTNHLLAKPNKKLKLREFETEYKGKELNKQDAEKMLEQSRNELAEIQDMFYADNRYSV